MTFPSWLRTHVADLASNIWPTYHRTTILSFAKSPCHQHPAASRALRAVALRPVVKAVHLTSCPCATNHNGYTSDKHRHNAYAMHGSDSRGCGKALHGPQLCSRRSWCYGVSACSTPADVAIISSVRTVLQDEATTAQIAMVGARRIHDSVTRRTRRPPRNADRPSLMAPSLQKCALDDAGAPSPPPSPWTRASQEAPGSAGKCTPRRCPRRVTDGRVNILWSLVDKDACGPHRFVRAIVSEHGLKTVYTRDVVKNADARART